MSIIFLPLYFSVYQCREDHRILEPSSSFLLLSWSRTGWQRYVFHISPDDQSIQPARQRHGGYLQALWGLYFCMSIWTYKDVLCSIKCDWSGCKIWINNYKHVHWLVKIGHALFRILIIFRPLSSLVSAWSKKWESKWMLQIANIILINYVVGNENNA